MQSPIFHNVHAVHDGLFNTVSGRIIDLVEPDSSMIHIEDISHALSNLCRFGGHAKTFWPVSSHSVLVALLSPDDLKKEALLHDATEAYLGDVIKPLKEIIADAYENIESRFMRVIAEAFGLDHSKLLAIKKYDKEALTLEHEYLQKGNGDPLFEKLVALNAHSMLITNNPTQSKVLFEKHFNLYFH
jgi:hypothetical protein